MKNRFAFFWKVMGYILIPIAIAAFCISAISLIYINERENMQVPLSYTESQVFIDNYMESIYDNIHYTTISLANYSDDDIINAFYSYYSDDYINTLNDEIDTLYYNLDLQVRNFKFLIIDTENRVAYTNINQTMRTDTIEGIKEELAQNEHYWNYSKSNIDTNIEKLSLENIRYESLYNFLENNKNIQIYTSIPEKLIYMDQYYDTYIIYNIAKEQYDTAPINIAISVLLFIISLILVTVFTGRKRGEDKIYLNWYDKIPLGITLVIGIIITYVSLLIFQKSQYSIEFIIFLLICYFGCAVTFDTLIKRIKSHTLFKSTLIYLFYKICKKIVKKIFDDINLSFKLALIIGAFFIANLIVYCMIFVSYDLKFFGLVGLLALWGYVYYKVHNKASDFIKIKNVAKQVYEGNTKVKLDENLYSGVLKELCIYINDITGGFSNAIQEGIKSERMKTELITNVSHDIKTPLTSIINYVDLLKKEEMPNEKAKEYLDILDKKSQRLKKLTEDLVDASKASSGNIKLNMEKINIKELINQISGEFEDKFKERNLSLIIDMPEENVFIKADSRYTYRVIENMYSNVVKYALENSRVYVDVTLQNNEVGIIIKNISKEKLNITSEELMQRFVRGDSSRNTEGSGLGLSIAQSLTTLQNGKFIIYLDGDLFKVVITFKQEKE